MRQGSCIILLLHIDPEWNEELKWVVRSPVKAIEIKVYEVKKSRFLKNDTFLGRCKVTIGAWPQK